MIFWIKTASLFLIRSKRASIILTLMDIMAVSSLVFLASLAMGVNDAMIRNSVGLFSGHISGFNIPGGIDKKVLSVKGVEQVLKRIPLTGFLHGKNNLEMITLFGVEPAEEKKTAALFKKIIKGEFTDQANNGAVISEAVSKRLDLTIDDTVNFSETPLSEKIDLKITGIYKTGIDKIDNDTAFCEIGLFNTQEHPWNAAIFLKEGIDNNLILQQYKKKGLDAIEFQAWQQAMPDLEQLIRLNYFSMSIVIIIVFIIVSLGITSAFIIFIFRNIREYGIMKVMGITSIETFLLLFFEVLIINIAASVTGLILGAFLVMIFHAAGIDLTGYTSHNPYFIVSGIIYPRLTVYSLLFPPLFSLVFSLPAAVWPAVMVIRQNAADILRGH